MLGSWGPTRGGTLGGVARSAGTWCATAPRTAPEAPSRRSPANPPWDRPDGDPVDVTCRRPTLSTVGDPAMPLRLDFVGPSAPPIPGTDSRWRHAGRPRRRSPAWIPGGDAPGVTEPRQDDGPLPPRSAGAYRWREPWRPGRDVDRCKQGGDADARSHFLPPIQPGRGAPCAGPAGLRTVAPRLPVGARPGRHPSGTWRCPRVVVVGAALAPKPGWRRPGWMPRITASAERPRATESRLLMNRRNAPAIRG